MSLAKASGSFIALTPWCSHAWAREGNAELKSQNARIGKICRSSLVPKILAAASRTTGFCVISLPATNPRCPDDAHLAVGFFKEKLYEAQISLLSQFLSPMGLVSFGRLITAKASSPGSYPLGMYTAKLSTNQEGPQIHPASHR
jgi:hypothetical protein